MLVTLIVAGCVLLPFALAPNFFRRSLGAVGAAFGAIALRPFFAILLATLFPVTLRLAMLPWMPIPLPRIHDEFSYLLAADTFAHGRLTNPTHPLWQFFETFHVLQHPSYMSKYPPVQGMLLALGQAVFGHPWWGVVISIALMCGTMCWMLRAWLPPKWALLGSLAVGLQFGVAHYWMNSYWGGAPGVIGACLLLGSYGRLRRFRPIALHATLCACLLALGLAILLNGRPWEGTMISLPVAVGLLYWLFKDHREPLANRLTHVILPASALLIVAAASMMYYCWRITGHPLELPYTAVHKAYSTVPLFAWQKSTPAPVYHHAVMQKFYTQWEPYYQSVDQLKNWPGWLKIQATRLRMTKNVLFGNFFLSLCAVSLVFFRRNEATRSLLWIFGVFLVGLSIEGWCQIHYFGPVLGVATVLKMQSLRSLSSIQLAGRRWGQALAVAAIACSAVTLARDIKPEAPAAFPLERAKIQNRLATQSGQQVVVVRYTANHNPIQEWVYNKADIDGSKIVWAREMSPLENQKLFAYFKGRQFWLLQPDISPDRLQAITGADLTCWRVSP